MYYSEKPFVLPMVLTIISITLNYFAIQYANISYMKGGHQDMSDPSVVGSIMADDLRYLHLVYFQMPNRMSPYLFGMFAA